MEGVGIGFAHSDDFWRLWEEGNSKMKAFKHTRAYHSAWSYHPQDRSSWLLKLARAVPPCFHSCQAEVADFHRAFVQKDVVGLKVTMNDVLGMKITENKKSRNDKSKRNVTNVGSRNRETSQSKLLIRTTNLEFQEPQECVSNRERRTEKKLFTAVTQANPSICSRFLGAIFLNSSLFPFPAHWFPWKK